MRVEQPLPNMEKWSKQALTAGLRLSLFKAFPETLQWRGKHE
ncbi:MAG: hypothetical protein QW797_08750 [Thermoproteota archaeon]